MSTNGNATCRRGGRGGTPALLLFLACAASTALCDDAQPVDEGRKLQLPPEAVAHRVIHMDIAPFLSPLVQRVSLPLPDGSSLLIRRARLERPSGNTYVWHGKVEKDDRSIATFAIAPPDL